MTTGHRQFDDGLSERERLIHEAGLTLQRSMDYAYNVVRSDGHWCGEMSSNVTITAEYIFLRQALGLDLKTDGAAYCRHILSQQNSDGSWGLAPEYPGDVSTTTEAYLALKMLGLSTDAPAMQQAKAFVLNAGGVAKVRVFTRIFLATFGLFPWKAVPQLPVELILLPSACPINIYKFASWARGTIAPLLIICHHQPVYALPNGVFAENEYLDELWQDPTNKSEPYSPSIWELLSQGDITGLTFSLLDKLLYQLNGLRSIPLLRSYALKQCMKWILERQEPTGDWAGIFPPMHASVYAFVLEGYKLEDPPVRLGIEALENFAWEDAKGKRVQPCVSPVWDTTLMSIALSDAATPNHQIVDRAIQWIRDRQLLEPRGDWRVYRPRLAPGGFSFEYTNSHYPDIDDSAAIILAQVKHDPISANSSSVIAAATWILGMQNPDGGWAAFDVENDKLFLNKIPFSDMDSLCDTSCADITGRILEAFGLLIRRVPDKDSSQLFQLLPAIRAACRRGIRYLASTQEANGAWFGRWGCNYIYGTSHALCGLAYFLQEDQQVPAMVQPALQWLKSQQNDDGGWGESLLSYQSPERKEQRSTASQTAWALMGLLAHLPHTDIVIERGIRLCHDFTFRFDDVLDASKLEAALDRLMEIGDWGQLGARLRLNDNGKLEYHIPAEYDKSTRPAFGFTTAEYGISINEHPLGARLPTTGQDQSVLSPSCAEFAPLVRHEDSPRELADWIYSDRPQLHVHVAVFEDATLLTVSYLHTLFDAVARTNFFKAWIAVLEGREEEVPPFVPFDQDPLCQLGKEVARENYTHFGRLVAGLSLVLFGLRYLFELLWFRKEEEHPIRVPGHCVERMRETAQQELAAATPEGAEVPFLSEPDVVSAWWVKTMVTALNPAPSRTVMVMSPFNVWGLFKESFPAGAKGFIGNAFFNSYTVHKAGEVLEDNNLAHLACKNRQALVEHRTKEQVQAMTAIQRQSFMQFPPLVGDSNLLFMTHTNQHKARYFETDFSAAVVATGVPLTERPHALGRPSYINDIEHCRLYPTRNVCRVIGKDAAGDWWLLFKTRSEAWPSIHRQLATLLGIDPAEARDVPNAVDQVAITHNGSSPAKMYSEARGMLLQIRLLWRLLV
ncbi:terpenoid cyclases/protein prenyltransferase alpha-alpha toroid [Aspergillus flavus]|uniref:Terpenoid cyclases/protein prenyltransferase alpha-alpha toroid n=1 Tax=Aspergillus flavus (strain ATCC 200026 / FGSC A1120 / IAM 13836 / NRRL 3357 / JCM 12722 / SRRC 167) TaxID=332952 RepID=A0A7U2MCX9_ASPFN|nr:terpenoid cyclases/protein prenyltransferase alpha-alpha toroid [Aspergillus flavus]